MATRKEVAERAGVSPSTVSYVLTGRRPISDETKKRVMSAVEALQYRPNHAAGALAGGKSKIVALVLPTGRAGMSPAFVEYINGVSTGAREHGYHSMVYFENDISIEELIHLNKSGLIDGVILMEIKMNDKRINKLKKSELPFMMIGRNAKPVNTNYVDRDFANDAKLAINHLTEQGHKNLLLVRISHDGSELGTGADGRFSDEIKKLCKEKGLILWEEFGENAPEDGKEIAKKIKEKYPQVSAVLTFGDLLTVAMVNSAPSIGLKIPSQIAVLALALPESSIALSALPITSVSIKDEELGYEAVNGLITTLEKPYAPHTQKLWQGQLYVRETA